MKENIIELYNKFVAIKKLGWIKSLRKGPTGVGMTFEYLIGKTEDFFELPDFKGIEIKARREYSKSYISLFNATPDGKYIFEIKRLTNKFGYPDKKVKFSKRLCGDVFANHLNMIGIKYQFKLVIDYNEEKVFLHVYNSDNELIDKNSFWTFKQLREKLERKFKYLAIVSAKNKINNDSEFFYYYKIEFFTLKSFECFLNCLNTGKIKVTFKVSVKTNEKNYGEIDDHGTSFAIKKEDISFLFQKINFL